jgi:hypothetical protein
MVVMGEGSQVERLWTGNDDVDEMEKESDKYIPFSQQGLYSLVSQNKSY